MTIQPQDKFVIRMPDGMRDEIALAAKANGRTMNAEMIRRLSGYGETLRDRIACHALSAVIAATSAGLHHPRMRQGEANIELAMARDAYSMADAMLAARMEGANPPTSPRRDQRDRPGLPHASNPPWQA